MRKEKVRNQTRPVVSRHFCCPCWFRTRFILPYPLAPVPAGGEREHTPSCPIDPNPLCLCLWTSHSLYLSYSHPYQCLDHSDIKHFSILIFISFHSSSSKPPMAHKSHTPYHRGNSHPPITTTGIVTLFSANSYSQRNPMTPTRIICILNMTCIHIHTFLPLPSIASRSE